MSEETGMIFTIEELDRKMAGCHAAAAIPDAAMRRAFMTLAPKVVPPASVAPT